MGKFTRRIVVLLLLGAGAAAGLFPLAQVAAAAPAIPAPPSGSYTPLSSPTRVCDTRAGNPSKLTGDAGQCLAEGKGTIQAGTSLDVAVAGHFNVPSTATAVVLNVTAVNPATAGILTVYPTGQPVPTASNLNVNAGGVVANLVQVGVGTGGDISIFASTRSDVVVDVQGYFSPTPSLGAGSGLYTALPSPLRICDTRPNNPSQLSGDAAQCNHFVLKRRRHPSAVMVAGRTTFGVPPGTIAGRHLDGRVTVGRGHPDRLPRRGPGPPTASNAQLHGTSG